MAEKFFSFFRSFVRALSLSRVVVDPLESAAFAPGIVCVGAPADLCHVVDRDAAEIDRRVHDHVAFQV